LENNATWQDLSYVNPENVLTRVYGTLKPYNPNLFAGYLVAGISSILGVGLILTKNKNYKLGVPYLFLFLVSLLAVFLTGCRGAYISLFVIILGIALASYQVVFNDFNSEKIKKIWKTLFASCSAFFVMFLAFNHSILQRLLSIFILRADSSTSFRMNVYNSSIQMFQDNWLLGIGVGNKVFREIYGLYMLSGFDALSTYCVFLEIAVESGIFALLSYLLFIGSLIFMAIKSFVNSNDFEYKVILFVSMISILAVMFHGLFDTVYFRPQIQYIFWTMCAILVSMLRK
jgi:putative inorganic carbon (HCO3(-)) transporter